MSFLLNKSKYNQFNPKGKKILFVGDSLFPGGNDNPVISTGVKTISVKNPEETKRIIKDIIYLW